MMINRDIALVLLSGGQDSATCLHWSMARYSRLHALSFDYGQRHRAELEAAREIALAAGVESHVTLGAPFDDLGVSSGLIEADDAPAIAASGGIVDTAMPEGLPTSFVPGRNLYFLAVAGIRAAILDADVVTGVCQTDYSGYPDCRRPFIEAMEAALNLALPSSMRTVTVHTPLMDLSKAQTVQLARELGDDAWSALGRTVTCYHGQRPGCGACPSCTLRAKGFADAGEVDPAEVAS